MPSPSHSPSYLTICVCSPSCRQSTLSQETRSATHEYRCCPIHGVVPCVPDSSDNCAQGDIRTTKRRSPITFDHHALSKGEWRRARLREHQMVSREYTMTCSVMRHFVRLSIWHTESPLHGATAWLSHANTTAPRPVLSTSPHSTNSAPVYLTGCRVEIFLMVSTKIG